MQGNNRTKNNQIFSCKYCYTCTLSPGEADLAKENNYQAHAPANKLKLGTSSGVDYIFSIHLALSPPPAVYFTVISRPFTAFAEERKQLPGDPTSIQLLNCLDVGAEEMVACGCMQPNTTPINRQLWPNMQHYSALKMQ